MDKEEIIAEIMRLKAETKALHEYLKSRQKEYVSDLRLVNVIKEREMDEASV